MFGMQTQTFGVTMAFILFSIIYITRATSKIGESKPSCQYCLETIKQNAAIKFLKFVLNAEHDANLVTKLNRAKSNTLPFVTISPLHHFWRSAFSLQFKI